MAVQVGGETIAGVDTVRNVDVGYILIESKAKVVDKGEEHFNEVWEGQVGVVGNEGAPDPDGPAI